MNALVLVVLLVVVVVIVVVLVVVVVVVVVAAAAAAAVTRSQLYFTNISNLLRLLHSISHTAIGNLQLKKSKNLLAYCCVIYIFCI